MSQINKCIEVINEAANYLRRSQGSPKILIKLSRNLGDSLHMLPVIKHYRILYPKAAIVFITSAMYADVHIFNHDIDKLFLLPNDLSPQDRLAMWDPIKSLNDIDIKLIPAIHPFGVMHRENTWSYACIADQVFANAMISDLKPLGGRKFIIPTTPEDIEWAKAFFARNNIAPSNCAVFEYNSYSHPAPWSSSQWAKLISMIHSNGGRMIGVAGAREGHIDGMIDGRGITWRQTVALCSMIPKVVGIGSGITMLACGAHPKPLIIEVNVSASISAQACGYADAIRVNNATPESVYAKLIVDNATLLSQRV